MSTKRKKSETEEDEEIPAPPYGSYSYWEGRYQSHEKMRRKQNWNTTHDEIASSSEGEPKVDTQYSKNREETKVKVIKEEDCQDSEQGDELEDELEDAVITPAGHSWYFTYEELAPLLVPIILGEEPIDTEDVSDEEDPTLEDKKEKKDNQEKTTTTSCDNDIVNMTNKVESNPNTSPKKLIIYKEHDTKAFLEIGCGDVPLGIDFSRESKLCVIPKSGGGSSGSDTDGKESDKYKSILRRIVCCDYSEICIEYLNSQKQEQEAPNSMTNDMETELPTIQEDSPNNAFHPSINETNGNETTSEKNTRTESNVKPTHPHSYVNVEYKVHDARNLPYKTGEFDIVCDKGTLDAMLSDKVNGIKNCVRIVAESGRVLNTNGIMIIVSHLNANTSDGLKWLDEVVVPGLRQSDSYADWVIESHGADDEMDDEGELMEEEEEDGNVDDMVGDIDAPGDGEEDDPKDGETTNAHDKEDGDDPDTEEDGMSKRYGPAVYIIRKKKFSKPVTESNRYEMQTPKPIPLKFFSY